MQEALRPPVCVDADEEERAVVADPEERIERHHETALGRRPAPGSGDLLELRAQRRVDLARPQHARLVAGRLEPVHRLTHLADRPAFEREISGCHNRFVTVVKGP